MVNKNNSNELFLRFIPKKNRMNKKGWVKIAESFLAILLLMSMVSILINQNYTSSEEFSLDSKVGEILLAVKNTPSIRNQVLGIDSLPMNSSDVSFPASLSIFLENYGIVGTSCVLNVCGTEDNCEIEISGKEVYSAENLLLSNATIYSPRKIKLFCYENEV